MSPGEAESPVFDTSVAHIARVYDYRLGGKDNYPVDRAVGEPATCRSRAEVAALFEGLDLVEPGVVRVPEWRPRSEIEAKSPSNLWGGLARKP